MPSITKQKIKKNIWTISFPSFYHKQKGKVTLPRNKTYLSCAVLAHFPKIPSLYISILILYWGGVRLRENWSSNPGCFERKWRSTASKNEQRWSFERIQNPKYFENRQQEWIEGWIGHRIQDVGGSKPIPVRIRRHKLNSPP